MQIQIGDIIGDYRVTGILGRGGMGMVFRVRSSLTDRDEAMKVVLNEDPAAADRFLREIKLHASLVHPNIATLHTAMRIEDRIVMIMELVEGVSLDDGLRRGPLELRLSIRYIEQMLSALEFAHERHVIHRDIKPANVLIGAGDTVKLTDFGVARSTHGPRLTAVGYAVGTLAYMAPEHILRGAADARSDLYSLGVTCYEMLAGVRPLDGDTDHALMTAHLNVVPEAPASLNPRIPVGISDAVMRAIDKEPNRRFQTAREFRTAWAQAAATVADALRRAAPTVACTPPRPIQSSVVERLTERLCCYIGPIAKVLVTRAARKARNSGELRDALAVEIPNAADRERFLATDCRFL